ncbi:MAG: T9SS type A sorting domain-containing protein [Balneolales bacterium]
MLIIKLYYFSFLLIFISTGLSSVLSAQTTSWNGSENNLWSNPDNWSNGVPQAGYTAEIPWLSDNVSQPYIDVNTSFSTLTMASNPNTLTAADHITVSISGDLNGGSAATINANGADINVSRTLTIGAAFNMTNGNLQTSSISSSNNRVLNVNNGTLTIANAATVGGNINLGDGVINFLGDFNLGGSGSFEVQAGTVNVGTPSTAPSFELGGNTTFNINDGTLNVYGSSTVDGSGKFYVDNGSVNFYGSSTMTGGGDINGGNGAFYFGNEVSISGGGEFNAENSTIDLDGADWHTEGGGTFEPGTSTINVSGSSDITGNDMTFYNLNVDDGGATNSSVNITVLNDMKVDDEGDFSLEEENNLNVVGNVTGDPQVNTDRPYIISIRINSPTNITAVYDTALVAETATNASNYRVENAGGETIDTPANLQLGGPNSNEVTMDLGFAVQQDIQYYLIVNNVRALNNAETISADHRKRFTDTTPPTFYSRVTGPWSAESSWSTISHTGGEAGRLPGQTGDQVIISNGHTITISNTVPLSPFNSVTVDHTGILSVNSSGTLVTGQKFIQGDGTFEFLAGGTMMIGSPEGISNEGVGNIRTATRTFSSEGNYIYNSSSQQITGSALPSGVNNLKIDNEAGVVLNTSHRVNGSLILENGIVDVGDGLSLAASDRQVHNGELRYELIIDGEMGYRMLSSPLAASYGDFLNGVPTQGFTGASLSEDFQANVLWYDETFEGTDNERWRAPADAENPLAAGRGLHVYMFGEVSADERYNTPFPYTLTLTGQENEGSGPSGAVDLNVTYTAEADTGWNLVGNPFGAAIDWDGPGWDKSKINESIYIWDPNVNQYQTWNGTTGDLPNGKIAPFQGFWVKADAPNPSLTVNHAAKTIPEHDEDGRYVGKRMAAASTPVPSFTITAEYSQNHKSSAHLMFTKEARNGRDPLDAYKLQPPPGVDNYLEIYSVSPDRQRLAINNLPRRFGKVIEIPVELNAFENGQLITDHIFLYLDNKKDIPEGWDITLINKQTNQHTALSNTNAKRTPIASTMINKTASSVKHKTGHQVVMKSTGSHPDFVLRIDPGEDASQTPSAFGLEQNYPNPFNPATTIQFDIPVQGGVRLEIYDAVGRRIGVLIDGELPAGVHDIPWDASKLSSGIYIYRLITPEGAFTKKMTLIK